MAGDLLLFQGTLEALKVTCAGVKHVSQCFPIRGLLPIAENWLRGHLQSEQGMLTFHTPLSLWRCMYIQYIYMLWYNHIIYIYIYTYIIMMYCIMYLIVIYIMYACWISMGSMPILYYIVFFCCSSQQTDYPSILSKILWCHKNARYQ